MSEVKMEKKTLIYLSYDWTIAWTSYGQVDHNQFDQWLRRKEEEEKEDVRKE